MFPFRCPDFGHCVHYTNGDGECCYKIVCERDTLEYAANAM